MSDYTDIVPEIQRIKSQIYNLRKQVVETYECEDRLSVGSVVVRLDDIDRNMEDVEEICSVLADNLEEKYSDPKAKDFALLKKLEGEEEELNKEFAALCKEDPNSPDIEIMAVDLDRLAAEIKIIKEKYSID